MPTLNSWMSRLKIQVTKRSFGQQSGQKTKSKFRSKNYICKSKTEKELYKYSMRKKTSSEVRMFLKLFHDQIYIFATENKLSKNIFVLCANIYLQWQNKWWVGSPRERDRLLELRERQLEAAREVIGKLKQNQNRWQIYLPGIKIVNIFEK